MAKSSRKTKIAEEAEKPNKDTQYLNSSKRRKIACSEVNTLMPNNDKSGNLDTNRKKIAKENNTRKSSRISTASQSMQKPTSAGKSSQAPASKQKKKEQKGDDNIEAKSNKALEKSSKTRVTRKASTVSQKAQEGKSAQNLSSKRLNRHNEISTRKKQKVLLNTPSLPEAAGDLLAIGTNDQGQLGLSLDIPYASRPKPLQLQHAVFSVVAGGMHTMYLSETGEVYTFGCNDEKALGRETADDDAAAIPGKVDLPETVVQISAGDSHSAALTSTGKVYIWGNYRDSKGQMGLTSSGRQDTPLQILSDTRIVKIASGDDHFVCLSEEGLLYTCGCAEQGQLGRLKECFTDRGGRKGIDHILTPEPVYTRKKNLELDEVWTGSYSTFAREKHTGNIYGFGLNNYNQLGFPDQDTRFCPDLITSFQGKKWKMISGGQHHTLALDEDGKVYSMGRKEYGRLGLGEDCEDKSEPTCIPLLADKKCICICAGSTVSFAVTDDGKVYSWGMGDSNQLGHGNDDDAISPKIIFSKSMSARVGISVSAGGQHAMIVARNLEKPVNGDSSKEKVTSEENRENNTSDKEQSA